jgi:hypothetical protein
MAVGIQCKGYARVSQPLAYNLEIDSSAE